LAGRDGRSTFNDDGPIAFRAEGDRAVAVPGSDIDHKGTLMDRSGADLTAFM
jgi:hypothetical protein